MAVDFARVVRNALRDGVDLEEISIKYEGLTDEELTTLRTLQEVTHDLGGGACLAKFPPEGMPAFPEKATAVLHLGA